MKSSYLDVVVIGSGLSALNFANEFLKKNKKINIISLQKENLKTKKDLSEIKKDLPPQIYNENCVQNINKFHEYNSLITKNVDVLGSMKFGGLSNYWGNQVDFEELKDLEILGKKEKKKIIENLKKISKDNNFAFRYKGEKKKIINDIQIPNKLSKLLKKKFELKIEIPTLAIRKKKKFVKFDNDFTPYNSESFFKNLKKSKYLNIHNYYVEKIECIGRKYRLTCRHKNEYKEFVVNKLILACGTIATTKLLIDLLKIKKEIPIKHHQRLICGFLSKNHFSSKMHFLNSILWFKGKTNNIKFIGDLRIGSQIIINAIIRKFSLLKMFKFFLDNIKNRIFFSNIFLSTKYSNLYIKKEKKNFLIYPKKNLKKNIKLNLISALDKVYKILRCQNLIYPLKIKKIYRPGNDFHYCGSISFSKKKFLSVDKNCQLQGYKNLYVVDSSVFDFQNNLFPLGMVISNAMRVAKNIIYYK